MSSVELTTGTIKAVHGSPGPASGITYDVDINIPGVGVLTVNGVAPHCNRPPHDIIGADVETAFLVVIVGGVHQYFINEYQDSRECPA